MFDVIQEQHESINRELFKSVSEICNTDFSAEKLTDLIYGFFKMTENVPILKQLDADEIELLVRKLPREIIEEHLQDDTDTIGKMFSLFPIKKDADIKVISAAFHAIYYATLHKSEIGEDKYDEALRALIHGVVIQFIQSD